MRARIEAICPERGVSSVPLAHDRGGPYPDDPKENAMSPDELEEWQQQVTDLQIN